MTTTHRYDARRLDNATAVFKSANRKLNRANYRAIGRTRPADVRSARRSTRAAERALAAATDALMTEHAYWTLAHPVVVS